MAEPRAVLFQCRPTQDCRTCTKPGEGPGRGDTVCGVRCGFRLKGRRQGEAAGEDIYDTLHDAGQAYDRHTLRMGDRLYKSVPLRDVRPMVIDWRNADQG